MRFARLILALLIAGAACAETLYKSVGPNGKITCSDRPMAGNEKAMEFANLPSSPLSEPVVRYQRDLQKGLDARLPTTSGGEAQFFMATWCGYCRQAKAYLNARKIAYREYDVDTPAGKNAFAQFGGGGIPVLVWKGRRINGFSQAAYDDVFRAR